MTEHAETNGGGGRGRGGGGGGGIKTLSLSLSLSFFLRLNNFENKDVFSPEKKKKKKWKGNYLEKFSQKQNLTFHGSLESVHIMTVTAQSQLHLEQRHRQASDSAICLVLFICMCTASLG